MPKKMLLRYSLYIFCTYYHIRFLSPYKYQSEVNFGGQLQVQMQFHIHIWVVTFWPKFRVHSGTGSGPIYVPPYLNWRSTPDLDPAPDSYLDCNFFTLI